MYTSLRFALHYTIIWINLAQHNPLHIVISSMLPCCTEKTTIDTGSPFPKAVLALTVMW